MKIFLYTLLTIGSFSNLALSEQAPEESISGTYQVSAYTWCNAPISDTTRPGACSFQGWHQVDLDSLTTIKVTLDSQERKIAFQDIHQKSWTKDLSQCSAFPPALKEGSCAVELKSDSAARSQLVIYERAANTIIDRVSLSFDTEEIRLIRNQVLMVFKVSKSRDYSDESSSNGSDH